MSQTRADKKSANACDNMAPAASLRELADMLGLSHTTVSQALRDKPTVKIETRRRIQKAAKAAGYECSPLVGALMAGMRRKRGASFQGTVAIVDLDGSEGRPPASSSYIRELIEGAAERATELGFKTRLVRRQVHDVSSASLKHEDIHAAFILPVRNHAAFDWLEWSHHATVYADYCEGPSMPHGICPDHFGAMRLMLDRLHALGYRRPGLAVEQRGDERLHHRWSDAFTLFQSKHGNGGPPVLLSSDDKRREFMHWFETHNPDVVIGHTVEFIDWMRECGARVPETHGFCSLNITENPDYACAGIDQNARVLGALGMEQVIGQIYRNEHGIPGHPATTTISPHWVDGSTLRQPNAEQPLAPSFTTNPASLIKPLEQPLN
ncbi:DNA-binding LacI/PurR family transcriptional regulator [Ereboglobus sp. PH5-10]|uniref:LacI family DNA-binding transcriptional regulator n=1 Tax=Ereboglobus sp. PH5-10 TaxID=2940629 RepID=UPI0024055585|nr:LacI family DNA-binding transcriptional regulator [Ereboglobus sp. PH5-10]MDF9827906.1 DNA-binding LacI/PurR family transcriptional regulator [Ereboglobus sp. PH5-10]